MCQPGGPAISLPHARLDDGRSLYDAFGHGFTLVVATSADETEVGCALVEAHGLGVPLLIVRLDRLSLGELYGAPRSLVRPDQHIAWRGATCEGAIGRATLDQQARVA